MSMLYYLSLLAHLFFLKKDYDYRYNNLQQGT